MTTYRKSEDKSRIAIFALVAVLAFGFVISQPALAANNGNGNNGNGNNGNGNNGNGNNGNGNNGNGNNGNLSADSQSVVIDENTSVEITLTGSGPSGFTYEIGTNPTHGTLTGTAPNMMYTPDTDYFGTDSFTFHTHKGGNDSPDATVSITVNEVVVVVTPPSDDEDDDDNNNSIGDNGSGSGDDDQGTGDNGSDGGNDNDNQGVQDDNDNDNTNNSGGNDDNQQESHVGNSHSWSVAIQFADKTADMDFTQVPESTTGVTLYNAVRGPLGVNFVDLLMSFDLKGIHSGDLTDGQMVWLLEHFDELLRGS
ncbi:hypothetical protein NTE_00695 [Candidatus Nitrososphaera evergladensis SR1]|uniref:Uncharacterized protein n=1 Tax=Candidatus Nitrososphaera evergladensis SR1 TaxID=1459636 RepID=A0A075MNR7_9ARCH|nr:Ig-like domain-containing protein [Candidatus Nitrososphaera evergladensis]AIF82775.1 hypothetical protein NTE_00695 [Candidatus Nitrososphaera evergladensis SR1]